MDYYNLYYYARERYDEGDDMTANNNYIMRKLEWSEDVQVYSSKTKYST